MAHTTFVRSITVTWGTPAPHTHHYTVHMALVGYLIVFSFVTKPGQTLEFLLWGTIVPLNFLAGYHCSIVASTPQPMAYASTHKLVNTGKQDPPIVPLLFILLAFSQHLSYVLYTFGKRGPFSNWGPYCSFCYKSPVWMPKQTHTHIPRIYCMFCTDYCFIGPDFKST